MIIGVYAIVVITIGLRAGRKQQTSEEYFLAGRQLRWPFIGASIYAANISTEHFVGLAGAAYVTGMAIGAYEWIAVFCLVPLILIFLPLYIRTRIYTVPEFLEKRLDVGHRVEHFLEMGGWAGRAHDPPFGIPIERAGARRQLVEEPAEVGGQARRVQFDAAQRVAVVFLIFVAAGAVAEIV